MPNIRKKIALLVLGLLEVVFLALALASNVPTRSADLAAFSRYQTDPTDDNKERWLKERQTTEKEVKLRKYTGSFLALGNLCLIVWTARKQ